MLHVMLTCGNAEMPASWWDGRTDEELAHECNRAFDGGSDFEEAEAKMD